MKLEESLLEDLRGIPVVDAHNHVRGHVQCQPVDSVMDLLMDPYIGWAMEFGSTGLAPLVRDQSRPDQERWDGFIQAWPAWRATGYGRILAGTLEGWGFPSDHLRSDQWPEIVAAAQQRNPEHSRQTFDRLGIRATLTHFLMMPHFGHYDTVRQFLAGSLTFEPGFWPQLGTLGLHQFHDRDQLLQVSELAGVEINDLDSLSEAIARIVAECVSRGVVGYKDHRAYTAGLAFGVPDRRAAEQQLAALLRGEQSAEGALALSDYLFDRLIQLAADLSLPVALHTGYKQKDVDRGASLQLMRPLLSRYPGVRFDVYHLNYPYLEDQLEVVKSHPNVYANCCWTHIIDPAYTVAFLKSAIGAIPANHIFGYGSDFAVLPEACVPHLELALGNIAEALAWAIRRRILSRSTALEIAQLWLHDNPAQVYGI
ncbi:MAG: amidohydrolase family protein [Propionicimonas sp.]